MEMDHTGWHMAGYFAEPQNMRVVFSPAYSPELSLAEHFWRALRDECFATSVFADLDRGEAALTRGIAAMEVDPT